MDTDILKFNIENPWIAYTIGLLLLLTMVSTGQAQIYASQDGHLLDANPRMGSMGLNPNARLDALVPRLNNNLMITGNLTGGGSFQGVVPYRSPLEFQGTLASSTLSNFRRDSVGMNNLSSGVPARQPFVDASRTLTGIHQNQVVHSYTPYPSNQTVTSPFTSRLNLQANRTLAIRPLEQHHFSLNLSRPVQRNLLNPLSQPYQRFQWPTETPTEIFQPLTPGQTSPERIQPMIPGQGVLVPGQDQSVTPDDRRIQPIQPLTDEQNVQQPAPSFRPNEHQSSIGQPTPLQHELLDALGTGQPQDRNNPYAPAPIGYIEQGTNDTSQTNAAAGMDTGIGRDLLPKSSNRITHEDLTKSNPPSYRSKPFQPKRPSTPTTPTPSAPAEVNQSYMQDAFEERARQLFQANLQKANKLLLEGKYYQAADTYGVAMIYDHTNGAAHQGKAHALFGAGEYMSSAYFLYQALMLNPKLARTRTDLRNLFKNETIFQSRMKELNDWQTKSNAAELKFLQGYILYQVGSRDQARSMLTDALTANPTMTAIQTILDAIETHEK